MKMTDLLIWNLVFVALVFTFDLLLSNNKRFKFNRWALLTIPFLALLPLFNIPIEGVSNYTIPVYQLAPVTVSEAGSDLTSVFDWLLAIYVTISLIIIARSAYDLIRMYRKGSLVGQADGIAVYAIQEGSYALPGRLFINEQDLDNELVVEHEKVHLKQQHFIDLLFAQFLIALFWFNPMAWRWKILIQQNHEYLADHALMSGERSQSREYIHLLLDRALETNQFSLGQYFSLNSLISKRITMLNKQEKQKMWKTLLVSFMMVGGVFYLTACNKTESTTPADNSAVEESTAEEKIFMKADIMPEFPGGKEALYKFLGENIKYPKQCKEEGIEGMTFVSFVISKEGKVTQVKLVKGSHELLDEESIRVVNEMPNWTPGEVEGKAVAVEMKLPFNYKLPKEDVKD